MIQPKNGSIGFAAVDFKISLNGSYEYIVYINDIDFGFPIMNPAAVPRSSLLLRRNSLSGVYLKVTKSLKY